MNHEQKYPTLYRIAHRVNYATANLANALSRHMGYRAYHYLTHPLPAFSSELGFFSTPGGFEIRQLPVDDLREINRHLVRQVSGEDSGALPAGKIWRFDDPTPDLLIINQGSGISPNINKLFHPRPITVFYAECFTISDFYPREQWPMPQSMVAVNEDYRKRATAYAECCDAVVVPSQYSKSLWPAAYQSKIHVIFEGFDVDHLSPERIRKMSKYGTLLRRRFPGKKLVAFIGETIEPIRGFDSWVRAYLRLRQERDDIQFIVVSTDRIKYGELGKSQLNGVTSFKQWVLKEQGLSEKEMADVTWLSALPLYDYLSLLGELDVVIYPMYGMFANWSLFHALHMGTSIVASDRAYLPEIITNEENGLLANPDDIESIVGRTLMLLESESLRMTFRAAGRKTIEERYSLRVTADKLSQLLENIC